MHRRRKHARTLLGATVTGENTSDVTTNPFGTAMTSPLSAQSSNTDTDLARQRAIVTAARVVWAIADTAEQVANMRPTSGPDGTSDDRRRSASPSVRPRCPRPTPGGFLSSRRVPGGLAVAAASSPASRSSVSTPSSQSSRAPSPATSRPASPVSPTRSDHMTPPC